MSRSHLEEVRFDLDPASIFKVYVADAIDAADQTAARTEHPRDFPDDPVGCLLVEVMDREAGYDQVERFITERQSPGHISDNETRAGCLPARLAQLIARPVEGDDLHAR